MPYSAQRDLTGKHPLDVFPFLVVADNTGSLYDGTGSQIINLNITASNASYSSSSFSSSYAESASIVISGSFSLFATSGSAAQYTVSSSNSQTSSFISPPFGAVSNLSNATGSSAGTAGFTDAAELGAFILAVSSSLQTLNTLIANLRASGVVT